MCRFRTCAVLAAWLVVMLALPACSLLQQLQQVFPPTQLPPQPPVPVEAAPAPPPPQSLAPPSPDEAQAEMTQWLRDHGYKSFQISAILGDARDESGFNPCIQGPGGFSYTFQWAGRRLAQLHEFAHTKGCPQLQVQMAFADWELRNQPQFACFWSATTAAGAYAALRRGFGRGSC
jgi:tail lysozyme